MALKKTAGPEGRRQGLLKDGTRRRTTGSGGRGGGMPRIIWLGILVFILGAVFLFRSQNTRVPTGIGENQTIVTAPDVESNLGQETTPHSGDVDIAEQAPALTPEQPAGTKPAETKPAETKPAETKPAETKPAATKPAATKPAVAAPLIKPLDNGPYVVQIGSFGMAENADQEAGRLREKGWDALVKVGNTSDGTIIYRVHIGYFASRSDASTFIQQNRQQMSGAIAVHR